MPLSILQLDIPRKNIPKISELRVIEGPPTSTNHTPTVFLLLNQGILPKGSKRTVIIRDLGGGNKDLLPRIPLTDTLDATLRTPSLISCQHVAQAVRKLLASSAAAS